VDVSAVQRAGADKRADGYWAERMIAPALGMRSRQSVYLTVGTPPGTFSPLLSVLSSGAKPRTNWPVMTASWAVLNCFWSKAATGTSTKALFFSALRHWLRTFWLFTVMSEVSSPRMARHETKTSASCGPADIGRGYR